ncbi:MAG: glutamate 5-kinase [Gammaproteobacteria bacterium]|nr:glutamate 5-kinase [Gammaproteobacteria bacterium]
MKDCKMIVLKIGSALISSNENLSDKLIKSLTAQINDFIKKGMNFVIVTSGAISQGQKILNINQKPIELESLQALAAIGQQQLMGMYERSFQDYNLLTAQVLLTHADMNDIQRHSNAKATIEKILSMSVIPIINENDVVATDEIKLGDNDALAAMVSNLLDADLMIILTNQQGLYDKNPDLNKDAVLIKECNIEDIDINKYDSNSKSDVGTGGFKTKLQAVKIASASGTDTIVASGFEKNILTKIMNQEDIGTYFKSN